MKGKLTAVLSRLSRKRAVLLGAVIGLLFFCGTYFHGQECHRDQYTQQKKCTRYELAPFIAIEIANFFDDHNGAIQGLSAIVVACFTGVLLLVSRRQTQIAEAQSRAFVFIGGFNVELTTLADTPYAHRALDGVDPGLHVTRFSIQPIWKNSGTTPTKDMYIQVNWRPPGEDLPPDFRYEYREGFSLFLPPKSENAGEFIEMAATPNAIINYGQPRILENMQIGDAPQMFIWGRAQYLDIFDKSHFVEWCYRIHFSRHAREKLKVSFIQWGDYNRTEQSA